MEQFVRDWAAYAEGKRAARHVAELAATTIQEQASAALAAYVHERKLPLNGTPAAVLHPIADSFADGFLDEVIHRWGEEARLYQALLPTSLD